MTRSSQLPPPNHKFGRGVLGIVINRITPSKLIGWGIIFKF